MRIILITSKLNFVTAGGSVLDLHLKVKSLLALGHAVTVVTAFSRANKMPNPIPYAVKTENISSNGWMAQQRKVCALLKKYQPEADAFYIDGNTFLYGGGAYRWLGGTVPVVAFFNIKLSCWSDTQNNDSKKQTVRAKLKRKLRLLIERYLGVPIANHLDAFIFTTPMVEKLYLDFGFRKNKSHVVPDFVNTREIIERETITAEQITAHQNADVPVTLFTSGRMIKEKGFDMVLRALAGLKNRDRYRLIMCGGGPEEANLHALAIELGVASLVEFPGWVAKDALPAYFRRAHIFILPKWWIEYTSVLLIEAMAYGLPSIVPAGGGLEWLAKAGSLTFKEDDINELAKQIEILGSQADRRAVLGVQNMAKAQALDYRELGKQLAQVLQKNA